MLYIVAAQIRIPNLARVLGRMVIGGIGIKDGNPCHMRPVVLTGLSYLTVQVPGIIVCSGEIENTPMQRWLKPRQNISVRHMSLSVSDFHGKR